MPKISTCIDDRFDQLHIRDDDTGRLVKLRWPRGVALDDPEWAEFANHLIEEFVAGA